MVVGGDLASRSLYHTRMPANTGGGCHGWVAAPWRWWPGTIGPDRSPTAPPPSCRDGAEWRVDPRPSRLDTRYIRVRVCAHACGYARVYAPPVRLASWSANFLDPILRAALAVISTNLCPARAPALHTHTHTRTHTSQRAEHDRDDGGLNTASVRETSP